MPRVSRLWLVRPLPAAGSERNCKAALIASVLNESLMGLNGMVQTDRLRCSAGAQLSPRADVDRDRRRARF